MHPTMDPAQIILGNSRLNDDWQLRYAIVTEVKSSTQAIGRYDGDAVKTVPLISLIGTLTLGRRVAVIFIPPAGNYVVGDGATRPSAIALGVLNAALPIGFSVVDLDSKLEENDVAIDLTNNLFTINTSGLYWMHGQAGFAAANGNRGVFISRNGDSSYIASQTAVANTGDTTRIQVGRLYRLLAGDVIKFQVWTNGIVNSDGDTYGGQYFSMFMVSP